MQKHILLKFKTIFPVERYFKKLVFLLLSESLTNGSEVTYTQQNSTSKSNQVSNTTKSPKIDLQIK